MFPHSELLLTIADMFPLCSRHLLLLDWRKLKAPQVKRGKKKKIITELMWEAADYSDCSVRCRNGMRLTLRIEGAAAVNLNFKDLKESSKNCFPFLFQSTPATAEEKEGCKDCNIYGAGVKHGPDYHGRSGDGGGEERKIPPRSSIYAVSSINPNCFSC